MIGELKTGANETLDDRRKKPVIELASLAHDYWRAPRKIPGSDKYEPRIKNVVDKAWIELHGGQNEVDIANTPYAQLPIEWQAENRASADIAIDEILKAVKEGVPLDVDFIEKTADVLHVAWLQRNQSWAPEELKKPYIELPDSEKEKDRYFVRLAIETYNRINQ